MINTNIPITQLNAMCKDTLMERLGIEYTALGENFAKAKMPVDSRTHQPLGLLHGGASVALAESVGSMASHLIIDTDKYAAVGAEINANHVRGMREGWVYCTATILHAGKSSHIWDIKITNEEDQLVCVCRLTMRIIEKR